MDGVVVDGIQASDISKQGRPFPVRRLRRKSAYVGSLALRGEGPIN